MFAFIVFFHFYTHSRIISDFLAALFIFHMNTKRKKEKKHDKECVYVFKEYIYIQHKMMFYIRNNTEENNMFVFCHLFIFHKKQKKNTSVN